MKTPLEQLNDRTHQTIRENKISRIKQHNLEISNLIKMLERKVEWESEGGKFEHIALTFTAGSSIFWWHTPYPRREDDKTIIASAEKIIKYAKEVMGLNAYYRYNRYIENGLHDWSVVVSWKQ